MFKSPVSDRHVVAVSVLAGINGEIACCLRLILLADTLARTVHDQDLPEDWIASTPDASGRVLTRSRGAEQFAGKAASAALTAASRENRRSVFKRIMTEGIPVTTAVRPVRQPGPGGRHQRAGRRAVRPAARCAGELRPHRRGVARAAMGFALLISRSPGS